MNSCGSKKHVNNWICYLWEQNPIHGFNFLQIWNAQHDVDGNTAKATSRFNECGGCATFLGWWQLSQEPFDAFIGVGLRKSVVLLSFMKFPWANTPYSCWVIFFGKGVSLCLCGLAQFVAVPSVCSFQVRLMFLRREPDCTTSTEIN